MDEDNGSYLTLVGAPDYNLRAHSWRAEATHCARRAVGTDLDNKAANDIGDEKTVFGIKGKIVQSGRKGSDYR